MEPRDVIIHKWCWCSTRVRRRRRRAVSAVGVHSNFNRRCPAAFWAAVGGVIDFAARDVLPATRPRCTWRLHSRGWRCVAAVGGGRRRIACRRTASRARASRAWAACNHKSMHAAKPASWAAVAEKGLRRGAAGPEPPGRPKRPRHPRRPRWPTLRSPMGPPCARAKAAHAVGVTGSAAARDDKFGQWPCRRARWRWL